MAKVLLALAFGCAAAAAPPASPQATVSRVFLRVRSVVKDLHLDRDQRGRKVDPFANATNASNFSIANESSPSPPSPPQKASDEEGPPPAAYPKQEGVTLPTMLPT